MPDKIAGIVHHLTDRRGENGRDVVIVRIAWLGQYLAAKQIGNAGLDLGLRMAVESPCCCRTLPISAVLPRRVSGRRRYRRSSYRRSRPPKSSMTTKSPATISTSVQPSKTSPRFSTLRGIAVDKFDRVGIDEARDLKMRGSRLCSCSRPQRDGWPRPAAPARGGSGRQQTAAIKHGVPFHKWSRDGLIGFYVHLQPSRRANRSVRRSWPYSCFLNQADTA